MRPLPVKIFGENISVQPMNQNVVNGFLIFLSICAILYFGQQILIPIVLAILLSFLLSPLVRMLQKLKVPKTPAIIAVVVIAFGLLFGVAAVVATTLTNLANDLPQYESNLRDKARSLKLATSGGDTIEKAANVLQDLQTELQKPEASPGIPATSVKAIPVEVRQSSFGPLDPVISVVSVLIHPMTELGIVILMVVLILFNKEDLRNRVIRLVGTGDLSRTTLALDEAGHRLSKLFTAQILLNASTGAFIAVALALIGIPGAILWGVLTAILRFVPYVGTLMSAVFPIIIAIAIGDSWSLAFITAGTVVAAEVVVGQVLEPLLFGKMTGLSPVAIVAAAAFWAALWGPIGLILATPMTIALLVIGRNIDSLAFFEVLLGSEAPLTPDHAFYQRMLASDPIEAAELADEFVQGGRIEEYLNTVAVPGLMLAHNDQLKGKLSNERLTAIAFTFSELLDDVLADKERLDDASQPFPAVLLVSAPGALNFAATLAFSGLLKAKNTPHLMLPQDAISPGKLAGSDMSKVEFICLCYLTSPTEAKHKYLERRVSVLAQDAKVISVAWFVGSDKVDMQSPANAMSILPKLLPETSVLEATVDGATASRSSL
jgi:predicted PurR-regulated permease PerM